MKKVSCLLCISLFTTIACNDSNILESIPPVDKPNPPISGNVTNKVKYRPSNYMMWDNWCIKNNDEVHLFHLQGVINGINYDYDTNLRGFGHAVSSDLLHWNEKSEVLSLYGKELPYEADFRYSGCTVEYKGKYYMFYTMRKWAGERIGVAMSDDLYTWTEYEGNPVIVPDARWFITYEHDSASPNIDRWDRVDCRDMIVVKDNKSDGFYGYFVSSSDILGFTSPTSVIGVAYSTDLLHWEQHGIAYLPTGVSVPEMIDVFEYDDTWYMTLTTAKDNGNLLAFSDPYITRGTIYATSQSPEGPFVEDYKDNVLLGGQINSGYSMRTIDYQNKKRLMYVDVNNGISVLSLPKTIGKNSEGRLRAFYAADLLTSLRKSEITPQIHSLPSNSFGWPTYGGRWTTQNDVFQCETDPNSWQAVLFEGGLNNIEMSFMIKNWDCNSFGIVFANKVEQTSLNDLSHILVIEPEKNRIYLTDHAWDFQNCRSYKFSKDMEYKFRCILMENVLELYINDELVFNSGLYNSGNYLPGLFANNGNLSVYDLDIFALEE